MKKEYEGRREEGKAEGKTTGFQVGEGTKKMKLGRTVCKLRRKMGTKGGRE